MLPEVPVPPLPGHIERREANIAIWNEDFGLEIKNHVILKYVTIEHHASCSVLAGDLTSATGSGAVGAVGDGSRAPALLGGVVLGENQHQGLLSHGLWRNRPQSLGVLLVRYFSHFSWL